MNMDIYTYITVVTICKFRLLRQYNQEWNLYAFVDIKSFKNITNVYMYFLISDLFSETIFGYVADLKQRLIFKYEKDSKFLFEQFIFHLWLKNMRVLKKFDTSRMGTLILDYEVTIILNQIYYKRI